MTTYSKPSRRSATFMVLALAMVLLGTFTSPLGAQVTTDDLDENGGYFCTQEAADSGKCNHPGTYACYTATCDPNGPTTTVAPGETTTTEPDSTTTTTSPDEDPPNGSATITSDGANIIVTVESDPGTTVQVLSEDGTQLGSGITDASGSAVITIPLDAGTYEISVVLVDAAQNSLVIHTESVTLTGPAPNAPEVTVVPGTAGSDMTVISFAGPTGASWTVDVIRDGEVAENDFGSISDTGSVEARFLLSNGPWSYSAKLTNGTGDSPASTGDFTVEIGAPAPPTLAMRSDSQRIEGTEGPPGGAGPLTVEIVGPIEGSATLTATPAEGEPVVVEAELNPEGDGVATLEVEDGTWTITGVGTDFQDQSSTPSEDLVWIVDTAPPALTVSESSGDAGQVAFEIATDIGARITIASTSDELNETFTATEATTTRAVSLPDATYTIDVTAEDDFGNQASDTLAITVGEKGSSSSSLLPIIIGLIVAAFVITGIVKRQDLVDWWYNRGYH